MANIIIGGKVHCPLCGKEFKEVKTPRASFYVCPDCMVSINKFDPAVGRWEEIEKNPCPVCKGPMKVFYRAADRYMQERCKCGLILAVGRDEYLPGDPEKAVQHGEA